MDTEEIIIAYIGAAAWIPQIFTWIYKRFSKPFVAIVPDKYAEVGYTSFGPIFNMRMALSSENSDLIITGIELILQHSDGDVHTLRWSGLSETFSEITDTAGNRQVVSRDQTPIALKVGTESLIEKFIRFQEPRYHEIDRPAVINLIAHFNFLKQNSPNNFVNTTLSSREFFAVLETRKKSIWWKAGNYQITLKLSSLKKFKIPNYIFSFELTSVDVDRLKRNVDIIENDLNNLISSNLPDFKEVKSLSYNWANVDVNTNITHN